MKKNFLLLAVVKIMIFVSLPNSFVLAETVSGNGYSIEQVISPIQGAVSGNGFIANQAGQVLGSLMQGGGFSLFGSFGIATSSSSSTPPVTPPVTPPITSGGGGFYVFSSWTPNNSTTTTSSTTPATSTPPIKDGTILTGNGSTCSTRISFSAPIDVGVITNNPEDVKKLELFLNTYENEKLPINGIYEARDVEAVKRWQTKYRTFILDPMRLKNPTGTIYTLSMRQIERQTTSSCGVPVVVTVCPFFKTNVSYGDRGDAVKKVQQFLNIVQGEKLPESGVFGPLTRDAVKRFQKSRKIYVTTYIPISIATGNWFTTTRMKANETIGCDILK